MEYVLSFVLLTLGGLAGWVFTLIHYEMRDEIEWRAEMNRQVKSYLDQFGLVNKNK